MEGVDIVIHLAARAHVMDDQSSDPLAEYRRINVDGTAAIAAVSYTHLTLPTTPYV